jgi:predicted aldo/keto reductase-like oxidoreductase
MVIKVIRPREKSQEIGADELIRYALSLENVHAAVIGTDSVEVIKKNIEILRDFKAMEAQEMANMEERLRPIFAAKDLPWMHPGYSDGILA